MATDSVPNPNLSLIQIKPAAASAASALPELGLEQARRELTAARGPRYWRSLEELSNKPGFSEMMEREFPRFASEFTDPVSRRGFLKLMTASLALAGLSACTKQPEEAIVPYVQQPEELIPGKPMYYATARPAASGAQPLLVKSNEYHPTKIEGNPEHPISRGATDAQSLASILDLYDPDRAQAVTYNGGMETHKGANPGVRSWGEFLNDLRELAAAEKTKQGAGLRFLTETVTSPTLAAQMKSVMKDFPQARWYQYDPVNRDSARAGARMAFGQDADAQYQLAAADVIVSLDADFLSGSHFPGFLKLSRDFASRRKLEQGPKSEMSRLYVVESQMSTTGGKADHRLPLRAMEVEAFAAALASALGAGGSSSSARKEDNNEETQKFLSAVVKDLQSSRGRSVVIPGEQQSPAVHALAAAINSALGNAGKTVIYTDTVEAVATLQGEGIKQLAGEMRAGRVTMLIMIGGNPVYNAPADVDLAGALTRVSFRALISTHRNETSRLCHWHVPMAHYLESWGDARAYDGTVTILQPLIDPLYGGKTAHEVVSALGDSPGATGYDTVRAYWQAQTKAKPADFEIWWRRALHDGFIPNTAFAARTLKAKAVTVAARPASFDYEIVFRPDPCIFDGRFANNGWLQELPKPVTKLTWDNAAFMSLATFQKLASSDWHPVKAPIFELNVGGRKIKAPVMIVPGFPDKTITVYLGYGQEATGRVGAETGFDAYRLRTVASPNAAAVALSNTGDFYELAITQHHHIIQKPTGFAGTKVGPVGTSETGTAAEGRELIRAASLAEYRKHPDFAREGFFYQREGEQKSVEELKKLEHELTLYPNIDYKSLAAHQWGMTIDMNSCVGCNACIAACVAENNIAVVGKEQVRKGREMHWLRVDTYFQTEGTAPADISNPRAFFQPIPCMQCENAPCEPVCPVAATVHSPEGLNNMVYNRCVGTRYCSNNCPYKVRRFNFLLFSDFETESLKPMRNPDVSVRSRGVMEKCTYCVQRISAGRIAAEKQDRKVRDGEVVTACQQSCPTGAIVFGDISDANSRVSRLKAEQRNYVLVAELNTRPRTSFIAAVHNPNPALAATETEHAGA